MSADDIWNDTAKARERCIATGRAYEDCLRDVAAERSAHTIAEFEAAEQVEQTNEAAREREDALTNELKAMFLAELTELSRKYGLVISGCGCCSSPTLYRLRDDEKTGRYAEGLVSELQWET